MRKMAVKKGSTALDLCCGTADWTIALAEAAGESGKVTGLDFSENMLEVARKKVDALQLKNVELIHGNAMELPFEDNTFDYVTVGFGLRNVPDYRQVLREMHRVLKPGGMAACLETSQPTVPGYRELYYFYFRRIMPLLGKWFAKSYEEYSWLQESARNFPGMEELAEAFSETGFGRILYKPFAGGAAAAHIAFKEKS
jgi:demethylmenaquinone methyltransferase/2-methoxy-6-polyprenyl-1,4-benzoquinol methylase